MKWWASEIPWYLRSQYSEDREMSIPQIGTRVIMRWRGDEGVVAGHTEINGVTLLTVKLDKGFWTKTGSTFVTMLVCDPSTVDPV